jgi:4-hydroxy-tetrahydrodipicolinate reductase
MPDLKVAIAGAGGKMGQANIKAVLQTPGLALFSAFDRAGSAMIGKPADGAEGVGVTDSIEAALDGAEAIIDFTAPANSVALAKLAAARGLVHVIGTTGCSVEDDAAIEAAGRAGARIVKAGNFSLGVNLLLGLVEQAARALPGFDIEILEMHHNKKVDAPSGTALMLGEAAAKGRNIALGDHSVRSRDGHTGAREEGTIGFATLRGGNVIGEHTVILAGPSERIELSHIADNRALFAEGAVRAALWAQNQKPGFYTMADVLGFNA